MSCNFFLPFIFKKVSMNRIYVNQKTQVVFPVRSVCPAVLGCLMVHIISLVDSGQQSILFALKTEPWVNLPAKEIISIFTLFKRNA